MAPRVDASEVFNIMDTSLTDAQMSAFIDIASHWVDELLVGKGLSSTILTDIELLLAAHFASLRDQRASFEEWADEYRVRYQGRTGMGLESTHYGQMAMAMDGSGSLSAAILKRSTFLVATTEEVAELRSKNSLKTL